MKNGKVNKVILILFFPVMAQLIFSCCCCDDDPVSRRIEQVTRVVDGVELFLVDNSGIEPITLPNIEGRVDRINGNAFGLEMSLFYTQFVTSNCSSTSPFNFFGTLTACSCDTEGPFIANETTLKNFKIVTLNDFDSSKLSGGDITPYFKFLSQNNFSEINRDSIDSGDFNQLMALLEKPKIDSVFQFEISFDVNDTLSIKDTTRKVILF